MLGIFNDVHGHNHEDLLNEFTNTILAGKIGAVYNGSLYSISAGNGQARSIQPSQKDTTVIGPHDAFVENAMIIALTSLKQEYMMLNHFVIFSSEGRAKLWNSLFKKSGSSKQGGT